MYSQLYYSHYNDQQAGGESRLPLRRSALNCTRIVRIVDRTLTTSVIETDGRLATRGLSEKEALTWENVQSRLPLIVRDSI